MLAARLPWRAGDERLEHSETLVVAAVGDVDEVCCDERPFVVDERNLLWRTTGPVKTQTQR
jgi:hypothetical protein